MTLEKIKNYLLALLGVLAGLFFYERSRRKSAEAVADNQKTIDKLNELNKQSSKLQGEMLSEEEKRKELDKDKENEKSNTNGDADFFNDRFNK